MPASTPVGTMPEPRRGGAGAQRSNSQGHNRDLTLQKYLLLQEQHEFLRQHLDELRPLHTSLSSTATSPSASPTQPSLGSSFSGPSPTPPFHHRHGPNSPSYRRTSLPSGEAWGTGLETIPDQATLSELAVEEARLCDVNEGIKRTLTELLNCETVRGDQAFRTWVQCRLMDTERELRSGRRRRSAPEP